MSGSPPQRMRMPLESERLFQTCGLLSRQSRFPNLPRSAIGPFVYTQKQTGSLPPQGGINIREKLGIAYRTTKNIAQAHGPSVAAQGSIRLSDRPGAIAAREDRVLEALGPRYHHLNLGNKGVAGEQGIYLLR